MQEAGLIYSQGREAKKKVFFWPNSRKMLLHDENITILFVVIIVIGQAT
jgi:hypothetical protein